MKVLQTANLGRSHGGVSGSIRYQVFDTLGASVVSQTNTGVYEVGSETGIYGVELNLSTQFSGTILWSVLNKPVYAYQDISTPEDGKLNKQKSKWYFIKMTTLQK